MMILLTGRSNSYAQLITVLIIFVVVLGATALTTKWIAGYQKEMGHCNNIELLDAVRLGNNKYVQIVRIGEKYVALAVCKDTVTVLGEIPKEQIKKSGNGIMQKSSFKDILKMVKQDDREKDHDSSDIIPNGTKDQDT